MLDIIDFITERGGNPEAIRESQRRRFAPVEVVDEVIELWQDHRRTLYASTQIGAQSKEVQKQIATKKKAKEDATELLEQRAALEKQKAEKIEEASAKEALMNAKLRSIGNIIHASVPISNTENDNVETRKWIPEGMSLEKRGGLLSHHEVLTRIDGYNPEAGVKVVGHRGYFLRQWGLFLNQAIINYGLEFLTNQGYTALQTPFMMSKEVMAKTAQLEDFDEQLYKVQDGTDDKYLIATSEQPISAFHMNEWLQAGDVPKKYAGYSTNFRREAGSHGKDTWGTFRVHQFEKIEQFVITDPEKSYEMYDQMIAHAENFYKSLGIPYRMIDIVSGAFNQAASKKCDLEAWFPYQQEWKELVSCSNCTDYQSRALDIRFGAKTQTDAKKKYVHCLNSTLTATSRTMCAIMENYQTEEGLRIPEPLRKYLPGAPDFIPFTKELPKDSTSQKAAGKGKGGTKKAAAVTTTVGEAGGRDAPGDNCMN